jgi:hypothetical protein
MSAKRATVVLALTAALALWSPPAQARVPHGGGGRPGGAHAVPRGGGSPGHPGGGVARARHPRAGTGGYGYASRAYRGYGGRYRPSYGYAPYYRYGGYYRPYYYGGYGYYGYYGPYASLSFGFGWPYGYGYGYGGAWPYGWVSSPPVVADAAPFYGYDAPPEGYVEPQEAPPPDTASARDAGRVRLEVRPDDASVYVDDQFRGTAAEARFLTLPPGRHVIELVRPGFTLVRREVEVVTGETSDVLVELHRP